MKCAPCQQGLHDMCNGATFCDCNCGSAGEIELTDNANASAAIAAPVRKRNPGPKEVYKWHEDKQEWRKTITFGSSRKGGTETIVRDKWWNFLRVDRCPNAVAQLDRHSRTKVTKSKLP